MTRNGRVNSTHNQRWPAKEAAIYLAPVIIIVTVGFISTVLVSVFLTTQAAKDPSKARFLTIINVIISLIASVAAGLAAYLYYISDRYRAGSSSQGNWLDIFHPLRFAYAQTPSPAATQARAMTPVQPYLGYMLSAILIILLVVFVIAVIVVLFVRDAPNNRSRRTAANDIVKTFGGFFIGVLTSFLKQVIGG